MPVKKQPVQFGLFLAAEVACILVLAWLAFSIIAWKFSVSPVGLRALPVVAVLAGVFGYVAEKWFI
jgi:hypothetical protein